MRREIRFGANEDFAYAIEGCIFLDFFDPAIDSLVAGEIGDIEDEYDAVCSLIVGADDGFEFFLAGSVPLGE